MGDGMPESPVSELAASAAQIHELFRSYVDAGFSERQALYLVGEILKAGVSAQGGAE